MPGVRISAQHDMDMNSLRTKGIHVMQRKLSVVVLVLVVQLFLLHRPGALRAEPAGMAPTAATAGADSGTTTNQMKEVVVTATRLPGEQTTLKTFPAHVTVISTNEIANSPAISLTDLLRQQVGLSVVDTVGFGQFGSVSLRGFGERTGALVLIDGVRVNDAGDSTNPFLWNSMPVPNIERVEVIHGGASTTYGEGAIGGVMNIITKKPSAEPIEVTATAAGGNLGYYTGHLGLSGTVAPFDYVFSGNRQEWNGWRDNSGYRGWAVMARPSWESEAGRFTLGYNYHEQHAENPGVLTPSQFASDPRQAGAATFEFDNRIHRAHLDGKWDFDSDWSVLGKVYGQSFDTDSASLFGKGRIEQPNYGTTWQTTWRRDIDGRDNMLTLGIEAIQQDFRSVFDTGLFGVFTTEADNWTMSVFANDTIQLTPRLTLVGGIRFDYREWDIAVLSNPPSPFSPDIIRTRHANVWSPKIGFTYELMERTTSWLSLSRSFRLPSGFDIGTAGSTPGELFYANPEVDPVQANTVDVGVRSDRCPYLGGSLVYFYSWVNDDILFNPFTFQNENFDSIRQGVELRLISRPAQWLDLYYNTAWINAAFDGGVYDGNHLPLVPEWQLSGGVNIRPIPALQLTLETLHVRGQTLTNDLRNDFKRNQYTVLNAKARYQWKQLTVFAAVNNLLDRLYETFPSVQTDFLGNQERRHNPAPGINFQIGATVVF